MKIAVECQSQLLQKSLELFLSKYLTSIKNCDIVIRDTRCSSDAKCFYISANLDADLIKPFSKSQLLLALENRYAIIRAKKNDIKNEYKEDNKILEDNNITLPKDFDILERRINMLTQEYQTNILNAIKAFYEK